MRIDQLGSRYVCTQSPEGEIRYLRASRLSSPRLFWIFRNFADLHQHVLTPGQLKFILNCEALDGNARVNPQEVIGTVELSAGPTKGFAPKPQSRASVQRRVDYAPAVGRTFAVSLMATAAVAATVVLAFSVVHIDWSGRVSAASSKSKQMAVWLLPRVHEAVSFRRTQAQQVQTERPFALTSGRGALVPSPKPVWETNQIADFNTSAAAEIPKGPALQRAALKFSSSDETLTVVEPTIADVRVAMPPSSPKPDRVKPHRSEIIPQVLPPAGPPESHPISGDFSSVIRDTEVMLRAIVSPEGRVKAVKILHGDTTLGREAARVVNSWRYAPHASGTDGESRIVFKFGSDVTTVSFLSSGPGLQSR